jgi:hypothetical protein
VGVNVRLQMPITARAWKLVFAFGAVLALVGVVTGGVVAGNYGAPFDWHLAALHGTIGAFLGAVAAPTVEPRGFRYPRLWQMTMAVVGCLLFAVSIHAPAIGYPVAVLVGCVAGYAANYWVLYASP